MWCLVRTWIVVHRRTSPHCVFMGRREFIGSLLLGHESHCRGTTIRTSKGPPPNTITLRVKCQHEFGWTCHSVHGIHLVLDRHGIRWSAPAHLPPVEPALRQTLNSVLCSSPWEPTAAPPFSLCGGARHLDRERAAGPASCTACPHTLLSEGYPHRDVDGDKVSRL